MKNKYRLKFEKMDRVRFIGHLDLLRVFQRSINRANIPISYSQGFNPHQINSFALPLPLGFGSIAEYLDIELDKIIDEETLLNNLNESLPQGLKIVLVKKIDETEKNGAATLMAASYKISNFKINNLENVVNNFFSKEEIIVMKKTKRNNKEVDIKPSIYKMIAVDDNSIEIIISSGSSENLKADLVIEALFNSIEMEVPLDLFFLRTEMYKKVDEKLVPLGE